MYVCMYVRLFSYRNSGSHMCVSMYTCMYEWFISKICVYMKARSLSLECISMYANSEHTHLLRTRTRTYIHTYIHTYAYKYALVSMSTNSYMCNVFSNK